MRSSHFVMNNARLADPLPTLWSFVPAGLMAPVAFLGAVLWPGTVHADGYVETSMGSYLLAGLHGLAVFGCVRGSLVYLWKHRGTLSQREQLLPGAFLGLGLVYLIALCIVFRNATRIMGGGS